MQQISDNNQSGIALVEFAFSCLLFFLLVFLGFEILRVGFNMLTIQFAINRTARWAVVGKPTPASSDTERANAIVQEINRKASEFGINIGNAQIRVCPLSNINCVTNSAGKPREFFQITVTRPFTLVIPGWEFNAISRVVAKNEPFDLS